MNATFEPITRERKQELDECVKELLEALSKKKQMEFIWHANELWLFIASVPRQADKKL